MARSVASITLSAVVKATIKNDINSDGSAPFVNNFTFAPETTLANGTNANQFDRCWYDDSRTINSGASENLDLYDLASFDIGAGAGKDALGQSMSNAELVGLGVWNLAASTGDLYIGGEGSGAAFQSFFHVSASASDTAGFGPLKPGGLFLVFSPPDPAWAIADTTNHLLKFAASGGNVTYAVIFFARSA